MLSPPPVVCWISPQDMWRGHNSPSEKRSQPPAVYMWQHPFRAQCPTEFYNTMQCPERMYFANDQHFRPAAAAASVPLHNKRDTI